jgi:hypothetical protein
MNVVVVGHYPPRYKLAYYFDWRDALAASWPKARVRVVNTHREWPAPLSAADRLPDRLRLRERLPLRFTLDLRPLEAAYAGEVPCEVIVYAPSFYYFNAGGERRARFEALATRGPRRFATVFFVENEYRRLADKVAFANALRADVLVTQLRADVAEPFYRARFAGRVLSLPAGLNPDVFRPIRPLRERPIDIGTRSHRYPAGPLGDPRNRLLERCAEGRAPFDGLRTDVSLDQRERFTRERWAAFLNRCRATVASEAAGRLAWDDAPGAPGVDFGALSSRHFEAMGTKTALLLLEGAYDGILEPGRHYFPVRTDLSNLAEVAAAVRDTQRLEAMTETARALALDGHTYAHRVRALAAAV